MRLYRAIALLGVAVATSLCAQTTYVTPAEPGSPEVAQRGALEVARSGDDVLLTWTLPEGEVRTLELYRNTTEQAPGRTRIGSPRVDVRMWSDKVPDDQTYWYWVKITRPNGIVVNIGPVATPAHQVWMP